MNTTNLPCKGCINKGLRNTAPRNREETIPWLATTLPRRWIIEGTHTKDDIHKKTKRRSRRETETLAVLGWSGIRIKLK